MKTPVSHDQMIKMFASQQDAILEINNSMKTAINATTMREIHGLEVKVDGVIKRQDIANDKVKKNTKMIYLMKRTTGVVNWFGNHLKIVFIGLFLFCYLTAWMYDVFNVKELIEKLILRL